VGRLEAKSSGHRQEAAAALREVRAPAAGLMMSLRVGERERRAADVMGQAKEVTETGIFAKEYSV